MLTLQRITSSHVNRSIPSGLWCRHLLFNNLVFFCLRSALSLTWPRGGSPRGPEAKVCRLWSCYRIYGVFLRFFHSFIPLHSRLEWRLPWIPLWQDWGLIVHLTCPYYNYYDHNSHSKLQHVLGDNISLWCWTTPNPTSINVVFGPQSQSHHFTLAWRNCVMSRFWKAFPRNVCWSWWRLMLVVFQHFRGTLYCAFMWGHALTHSQLLLNKSFYGGRHKSYWQPEDLLQNSGWRIYCVQWDEKEGVFVTTTRWIGIGNIVSLSPISSNRWNLYLRWINTEHTRRRVPRGINIMCSQN